MKGLLMTEDLFHATIEGRKTVTRRLGSLAKMPKENYLICRINGKAHLTCFQGKVKDNEDNFYKARFERGEIVFVKEPTWVDEFQQLYYKYTDLAEIETLNPAWTGKWANKMFMPESKARLFLKITDVYAQKLGDVSEDEAKKEGVAPHCLGNYFGDKATFYNGFVKKFTEINGSFDPQTWVWVYEYEVFSFKNNT